MPRFTLIKHPDGPYDSKVEVEFQAEVLDLARAHYEDFLSASGFVAETDPTENMLERAHDMMWDDAVSAKFSLDEVFNFQAAQPVNDGILGAAGADVIQFPTSDQ
jgi:hypothetical protein